VPRERVRERHVRERGGEAAPLAAREEERDRARVFRKLLKNITAIIMIETYLVFSLNMLYLIVSFNIERCN
jgi:hypothetical protein